MAPWQFACLRSLGEDSSPHSRCPAQRRTPRVRPPAGTCRRLLGLSSSRRRQARRRTPDPRRGRGQRPAGHRADRDATPATVCKVLTGARVDHGDVLVNVYVDGSVADAASALQGLGMRITATNDRAPQRLVAGWLPATKLLDATALTATKAVTTVHAGHGRGGRHRHRQRALPGRRRPPRPAGAGAGHHRRRRQGRRHLRLDQPGRRRRGRAARPPATCPPS